MDPARLFETSHAVKGVSANLGLVRLAEAASEISEEFRPGNPRRLTDEQVKEKMSRIRELYALTEETIKKIQKDNINSDSSPAAEEQLKAQQESLTNLVRGFM